MRYLNSYPLENPENDVYTLTVPEGSRAIDCILTKQGIPELWIEERIDAVPRATFKVQLLKIKQKFTFLTGKSTAFQVSKNVWRYIGHVEGKQGPLFCYVNES